MKDVRIDTDGELRCWNCGSKGFTVKRTLRSKAMVGVGALLTKKKLKCQVCGEYNDTGNAKKYDGPASRKYRKVYETEIAEHATRSADPPNVPAPAYATPPAPAPRHENGSEDKLARLERLASLHSSGALSDEEFERLKADALSAAGEP